MNGKPKELADKVIYGVIDRKEGNFFVVLWRDNEEVSFHIPARIYPDLSEGDVLDIRIRKDKRMTEEAFHDVEELKRRLREKSLNK